MAPEPWIDLSTGINPQAYPVAGMPPEAWTRLPEADALRQLEAAAARRYGIGAGAEIVAAPGTQAIIQRLPALLPGPDIRILGKTYGEYRRVFEAAGATVVTVESIEALTGADGVVIVNPNNPDGRLVCRAALARTAGAVGLLVVDEAFMDASIEDQSLAPHLPLERAIVLRSFGKFYGLAGLRLGFALAPPALAAALRGELGPWAVSGPALAIGARALDDAAWAKEARQRLADEAARLDALLAAAGFDRVGGTPLFRLVRHVEAPRLFEALARAGILTRPFAEAPTLLRFGLPGTADAWSRLSAALNVAVSRSGLVTP